eukprot:3990206-Pyramimonas_sp.AAC.1
MEFWELKTTKWLTVGSRHSECGPVMEFWDLEDHEICNCWPKEIPGTPPDRAQTPLGRHDALF